MENQTEEPKRKFYKRWEFWVLAVICYVIIINVVTYIKDVNRTQQANIPVATNQTPATVQKTVSANNSNNVSKSSATTVSIGGITYSIYTLSDLQNANLSAPSSASPSFVEINGTITKFISNSGFLITDGQSNEAFITGNNGSNPNNGSAPNDKVPLMSSLNVGDKITINGVYVGKAGDDSFVDTPVSLLPNLTPVVSPIGDTSLVVNSQGEASNGLWTRVFTYTDTAGAVSKSEESSSTSVPSFTVDSQHWRISWQIKNNDSMDGENDAYLTYPKNVSDNMGAFLFGNQKVSAGYSASGVYDGVGSGTYYVDYSIWANTTFSFTVEELK